MICADRVGVVPSRHQHRGQRVGVLAGSAPALQSPAAHRRRVASACRAWRAKTSPAPLPAASRAPRAGRRAGWWRACRGRSRLRWRLSIGCPVPVGARQPRCLRGGQRLLRDRVEAEARREHQALLRAADGDVDAPLVVAVVDRGQRGDRVDQQQRGVPCASIAARTSAMRLVTPVEVSLWTTITALIACAAVLGEPALDRRRVDAVAPVARDEVDRRARAARPSSATASRSGRSRTSARGRPARAC